MPLTRILPFRGIREGSIVEADKIIEQFLATMIAQIDQSRVACIHGPVQFVLQSVGRWSRPLQSIGAPAARSGLGADADLLPAFQGALGAPADQ